MEVEMSTNKSLKNWERALIPLQNWFYREKMEEATHSKVVCLADLDFNQPD